MSIPPRHGPAAHYDHRATKEFRRYYYPLNELHRTEPIWTDLHDDDAVSRHTARSGADPALTAFCQLAAHKLDVRRVLIFLFDAQFGYIVAEATRSLSLRDSSDHEIGDGLWLGHARIPRGFSICEHTVNLPPRTGSEADVDKRPIADFAHIINDLTSDDRFCNRPFVTDGPRARSYVGVPITTQEGVNIGALCALHDQPRETTAPEVEVLVELATTVMFHLEATRARIESRRRDTMISGLTAFVDGAHALHDDSKPDDDRPATPQARGLREKPRDTPSPRNTHRQSSSTDVALPDGDPVGSISSIAASSEPGTPPQTSRSSNQTFKDSIGERPSDAFNRHSRKHDAKFRTGQVFDLAAVTLRASMSVDGVVFLDAAAGNKAGATSSSDTQTPLGSWPKEDEEGSSGSDYGAASARAHGSNQFCSTLSVAYASPDCAPEEPVELAQHQLRSLARKYARGKVWHFDLDDDSSDASPSSPPVATQETTARASADGKRPRRSPTQLAEAVHKAFPMAQSVMFLPVGVSGARKSCTGIFLYRCSSSQASFATLELQFLHAFCDVVTSEADRMETRCMLHTKSAFVDSVSHELRTPLHGIFGTIDALREYDADADPVCDQLLSQVEVCSQTMLETVNHLLDFAHIDHVVPWSSSSDDDDRTKSPRRAPAVRRSESDKIFPQPSSSRISQTTNIDLVTENAIDSVIYSFYWKQRHGTAAAAEIFNVTTILDIHKALGTDWVSRLSPGAWSRICTNLVANALKYTTNGFIHIVLEQVPSDKSGDATVARLSVTDTGHGMSANFMQSALFQPFEQENSALDGVGLGLNLVSRIVSSVGGRLHIESLQGKGTSIYVSIPMVQSKKQKNRNRDKTRVKAEEDANTHASSIVAHFVGRFREDEDDSGVQAQGHRILRGSIGHIIDEVAGRIRLHAAAKTAIRVWVVAEEEQKLLGKVQSKGIALKPRDSSAADSQPAILVVCSGFKSLRERMDAADQLSSQFGGHVEYIVQPFGPTQIICALINCLRIIAPDLTLPAEILSSAKFPSKSTKRAAGGRRPSLNSRSSFSSRLSSSAVPTSSRFTTSPTTPYLPLETPPTWTQSLFSSGMESNLSDKSQSFRGNNFGSFPFPQSAEKPVAESISAAGTEDPVRSAEINTATKATDPHVAIRSSPPQAPPPTLRHDTSDRSALSNPASVTTGNPTTTESSPPAQSGPTAEPPSPLPSPEDILLLLVDDNDVNMRLLTMFAKRKRYRHLDAENGLRALEIYQEGLAADQRQANANLPSVSSPRTPPHATHRRPHAVLMDLSMPVMDGFEATRRIRECEKAAGVAPALIIAMTGLGAENAEQQARACGVDHFMTKPVRMKDVTALIREFCVSSS